MVSVDRFNRSIKLQSGNEPELDIVIDIMHAFLMSRSEFSVIAALRVVLAVVRIADFYSFIQTDMLMFL